MTPRSAARHASSAAVIARLIAHGVVHASAGVARGPRWRISVHVNAGRSPSTCRTRRRSRTPRCCHSSRLRLSPALFQPVAADDVAATLADVAQAAPVNGMVELGGPEPVRMDEHIRRFLAAHEGTEPIQDVTTDPHARYFGTELDDTSLTPSPGARLGAIHFVDWLGKQ